MCICFAVDAATKVNRKEAFIGEQGDKGAVLHAFVLVTAHASGRASINDPHGVKRRLF